MTGKDATERHAVQVDAWIAHAATDLPPNRLVALYAAAIGALQSRMVVTLSVVTVTSVLDRVHYQSQQKFPLLSDLKIDPKGISLDGILSRIDDHNPDEITAAFRFFLIESLTILENLTAGILTKHLYDVLSNVTVEQAQAMKSDRGTT